MEEVLPNNINYWMNSSSNHDCFFIVGPESGPKEKIGAIKVFLFGHSEVLQRMLGESPLSEAGDVPVIDSDPDTFKNYLRCVYGGTDIVVRKLSFSNCLNLLYLCEKYLSMEIKSRISHLMLQLHQPLSTENVLMSLANPACLQDTNFSKAIAREVQKNTMDIVNNISFCDLDTNAIIFIVKQEKLSMIEIGVWNAVYSWAQKQVSSGNFKDLRSCLKNILKYIRFCSVDCNIFCKIVVPSKVLTPEEVFEVCNFFGTAEPPKLDTLCSISAPRFKPQSDQITFTSVFKMAKFVKELDSSKHKLGEFWFNIRLDKDDENQTVGIFLFCSSSRKRKRTEDRQKTPIKCLVNLNFTIVNHCWSDMTIELSGKEFCNVESGWGATEMMPFKDLINPEKGFLKNNTIEVLTWVELI